jgi:outer membrane biogenesis lipoprotein LolB
MLKVRMRHLDSLLIGRRRVAALNTLKNAAALVLTLALLLLCGCGGGATEPASSTKYPTGISEDIEKQLKYDARVQDFAVADDGKTLEVNVNEAWTTQPQGMQERALGSWYALWHADHKDGSVVVKSGGEEVASWTGEGYRPASKEKKSDTAESS